MLAMLSHFTTLQVAKAQFKKVDISNLEGSWEFARPQNDVDLSVPFHTTLRNFDKEGNYVEISVSATGSYIQAKAKFEVVKDSSDKALMNYSVKETITYAAKEDRLGKIFNFKCVIVTDNGHLFLLTEGGKKNDDGTNTVEWREMWRKIEEFKKPG